MRFAPIAPLLAATLLSACANINPLDAAPHTQFHPAPDMPHYPAILPGGVAVLNEKPRCEYLVLGEAWVTHHSIEITPSRIEALQQTAAVHGADAIIIHPNQIECENGRKPVECAGRGQYVVATAIRYREKLAPPNFIPAPLEHSKQISYEAEEQPIEPQNLLPEYPL